MAEQQALEVRDLLVEIGTEELPPQALLRLSHAFGDAFSGQLRGKGLTFAGIEDFATPRRLALRVSGLATAQADQVVVRKGPALTAAFDAAGGPTRAALGFARSCGVEVAELEHEQTDKGGWLVFRKHQAGSDTVELVPAMVTEALAQLPIPKRMRWGDLTSEFVRPVHWVVMLFGDVVIEADILDVRSGGATRGHRFHHPEAIPLTSPAAYEHTLRDSGHVEPVFAVRRERVRQLAEAAAAQIGARVLLDPGLLDEVTALCEWPVPVTGSFDPGFLEVPAEALIETMQKNQKYFPVVDGDGHLLPRFIAISNIESLAPEQVRAGNERVVRPRFKDAAFFWEQDLKRPLDTLRPALDAVVYEARLGSLGDKVRRIGEVAMVVAGLVDLEPSLALRAAQLCKCDLLSDMVGEFASLQGVMGRYYASAAGEDACVAAAIEEHYLPRQAGDRLPASACGQALAIADRLDSLVGIFAIGQRPTGVKDPYGLRRASLGVLRILIETPLELDLHTLLAASATTLADRVDSSRAAREVFDYMMERLHAYYADRGITGDVVDAVLELGPTVPVDIDRRVQAVAKFRALAEAESLAAANKRIRNILKKTDEAIPAGVDTGLLHESSERELAAALEGMRERVQPLFEAGDYAGALAHLAGLRPAVDRFFDAVMVMSEDTAVRGNRLALVRSVAELFANVADISMLQVGAG